MRPFVASASLLTIFALLQDEPAFPCSPPCRVFVRPAGGTVPANLPGMEFSYYGPTLQLNGEPAIGITEVLADGTEMPFPVTVEFRENSSVRFAHFDRSLTAEATYKVRIASGCSGELSWTQSEFRATGPAEFPTTIGVLSVGPQHEQSRDVWTYSGSCTSPATISAREVQLELSPDAEPWVQALNVHWFAGEFGAGGLVAQTDGAPENTWKAWTKLTVYHVCESDDSKIDKGLPDGRTMLSVRASIPGSDHAISSAEAEVSLSCESGCASSSPDDAFACLVLAIWAMSRYGLRRSRLDGATMVRGEH